MSLHVHRWKSSGGKDYRINIRAKGETESDEDFQKRLKAAEAKASEYEAGAEFVANLREQNSQANMVELTNAALLDLMNQLDGINGHIRELQRLPTGQSKTNALSKATLDKMRLTGQKAALRTYLTTQPNMSPFADEQGEGWSFTMGDDGSVAAPEMGESNGMVEV